MTMTVASPAELLEQLVDGARYGDMEDVRAALDGGADVNGKDDSSRTALHMAAANGHEDVIRALLEAGADTEVTNAEGNTPMHWACLNGHVEVVKRLIQAGANPSALNSQNRTPVDEALDRDFESVMAVIRDSTKSGNGEVGSQHDVIAGGAEDEQLAEAACETPES